MAACNLKTKLHIKVKYSFCCTHKNKQYVPRESFATCSSGILCCISRSGRAHWPSQPPSCCSPLLGKPGTTIVIQIFVPECIPTRFISHCKKKIVED